MIADTVFYFLLFTIAFMYSSVGHGGASGYLALLALFSFSPDTMRFSALSLNLIVSGIAFAVFFSKVRVRWDLLLPLIIFSVPAAYLGSTFSIDPGLYRMILGILLIVAVIRLLIRNKENETLIKPRKAVLAGSGLTLGFISGLIGIGGGIILSPLMIIFRWASVRDTAAVSAAFIFVNSLSGLAGSAIHTSPDIALTLKMIPFAIAGGLLGSYSGSHRFRVRMLRSVLSGVLVFASFKLIFF